VNALKNRIDAQQPLLPGEDPAALQTLTDEHYSFWNPANPVERDLVNILVRTSRLLRRLDRVEDEIWTSCIGKASAPSRANIR